MLWQATGYAQRPSLCSPAAPTSVPAFGIDERKANHRDRWRT